MQPLDRLLLDTGTVRVGMFRCAVSDPRFRDSGPTEGHLIVFPRTSVWIQQAGSSPIVADPRVVTVYNRGREYRRAPVSREGDRCDWFAVAPEVALEIARTHDRRAPDDPARAYRFESVRSDPELYYRQRQLLLRIGRGELDPLEAEEAVLGLVGEVIGRAAANPPSPIGRSHRDLVERARAELAREIGKPQDVATLGRRLGVSPYHLCRVFRAGTGVTLHRYRNDLRLGQALERIAEGDTGLSRLAHELGFASQSHFTAQLRACYGVTPRRLRRAWQSQLPALPVSSTAGYRCGPVIS